MAVVSPEFLTLCRRMERFEPQEAADRLGSLDAEITEVLTDLREDGQECSPRAEAFARDFLVWAKASARGRSRPCELTPAGNR